MKLRPLVTRFSLSTALFWLLAASLPHLNDARAATNYTETFLPGVQSARSFGRALDIEGDTLAVSLAPSFEWGGIYIYKFLENSWVRTATLDIGAEAGDDDFGADVALAGFLVAGTPLRNSVFKGSTIVLRSSTMGTDWLPQAALFPPNDSVIGRFGASVAKSGSTIAVVAPTEEQGAVYVYAGVGDPTWQLQARLTAADGGAIGDSFAGVELSNNTLLVDSGNDAYVFERSGTNWVFQARLSPPPLSGHTGRTALDQNVAVVNGYVFVRHGTKWVRSQESLPSSSTTGFGRAAAIEGNTLVISAQGAAFVFQYNGSSWVQVDQLTPSDPTGVSGEYGYTLAINQGRILVGDQNHNQSGEQTGAVYVWTPLAGAPSSASATAQLYNGFVVGINLTDPGSGYTYTPFVRLIGGGGTGASAVATVVSNRVESIEIVNSGIGYTSAPTVVIQSPAEGPGASEFLDLRITYAAVTFELIPGKRYTLESSFDRSTWTAVGEPFIAQQATLTEEFAVEQTGRFFRLTEIGASPSNFVAFAPTQDLIGSEQILAPPVPTENREFGRSVAIDNDTTVASAWSTNTTEFGGGLGEIFFYDLNGTDWLLSQTYVHPRTLPDELGASLAIDGDVLVAGAPWFNLQRQIGGYAQQFVRQETNWVAADLLRGDQLYNVGPFGASVAVSGQTMAILNPEESVRNPENPSVELAVGAVYVHDPLLLTKLCATNSNTTNRFSAVALSGDTLLVASGNDAVVFTRTGAQWDFHSVLSPSGTNFSSLALDGNIAVVNGYVFLRRGLQWTEFQKLVPSTSNTYGPSTAIDGATIVVGANGTVSVFDFTRTNFVESHVMAASNTSAFGASVAISGNRIVVGDPKSDLFGTDSGAVYIYTRATAPIRPATAIAEVVNGYLVGFTLIDGGAGYAYAPPIHILDGSGTGASAVASVQNGTITALHILAAGSGYSSAPTMLIDTPANPLSAPVATISKPTKVAVDLHLVSGKQYLFESSSDLRNWTQLKDPFLAEQSTLTDEFPVQESAQFFRLTPIPIALTAN